MIDIEFIVHILEHAFEDTIALVPFLLVTYLVLEVLEHAAADRTGALVRRAGSAGPVVGALLGVVPQCGFSAMGATFYAGRVVTLGTLVAVFLSTSDEMLPLLLAEQVDACFLAQILFGKALIAVLAGMAIDAGLRVLRHNSRVHTWLRNVAHRNPSPRAAEDFDLIDSIAESGTSTAHIHELCEYDHCGCDDEEGHECTDTQADNHHDHGNSVLHIVRSALSHTIQVTVFIYLITVVLVAILETGGENALASVLNNNQFLAVVIAALVGLIPNCAASVVVTQLYLEGVLSLGAMFAGTLTGAGAGYLVLFRTNHNARENILILGLIWIISFVVGSVISLVA